LHLINYTNQMSMKKNIISSLVGFIFLLNLSNAQNLSQKEINNAFIPKGTYRAPFKKTKEVGIAGVNIQFKLATRQEQEKRGVGNVVTWGFLEGISDSLLQEITNEYAVRLVAKFKANGLDTSLSYKKSDDYKKLVSNNSNFNREVEKKSWGVSKIYTANNDPYIEFPVGMVGAHAALGNKLKLPVGVVFITIDFISIDQKITKGVSDLWGDRTNTFETSIVPVIRIEGVTQGAKMRGDGTYATFSGENYSFCNPTLKIDYAISSPNAYKATIEKTTVMPVSMKKFKNAFAGDMASLFSGGIIKSGRGVSENTFTITPDIQSFKEAVFNALDIYNDYLIMYIKSN
jgi:hypothetical protein